MVSKLIWICLVLAIVSCAPPAKSVDASATASLSPRDRLAAVLASRTPEPVTETLEPQTASPVPTAAQTVAPRPTTASTVAPRVATPATAAPRVTSAPTVAAVPATTVAPRNLCGAPANPFGYTLCPGDVARNAVLSPPSSFCAYFGCVGSFYAQTGWVHRCVATNAQGQYVYGHSVLAGLPPDLGPTPVSYWNGSCHFYGGDGPGLFYSP